jgi:hypothetical protein
MRKRVLPKPARWRFLCCSTRPHSRKSGQDAIPYRENRKKRKMGLDLKDIGWSP